MTEGEKTPVYLYFVLAWLSLIIASMTVKTVLLILSWL